jgi:uncharacterized protein YxeA
MGKIFLLLGITAVFLIVMIILAVMLFKNLRGVSGQTKYCKQNEEEAKEEKTCVYLPLDLNPSVLFAFKKACAQNGTSHTEEVERFIVNYCKEHKTDAPKD